MSISCSSKINTITSHYTAYLPISEIVAEFLAQLMGKFPLPTGLRASEDQHGVRSIQTGESTCGITCKNVY